MNCYLGIDIGSISTKGVIIDDNNNIICSLYSWTEGNPVNAVKNLINKLKNETQSYALTTHAPKLIAEKIPRSY